MNRTQRFPHRSNNQKDHFPIQHNPNTINQSKQLTQQSFSINNASNHELKQIIQKLITKSRSLIISLQNTLQQLQQTRTQKDFWKGHYIAFKNACEKYIQSRGVAPFEYINQLERTIKQWSFKKEENNLQTSYRSLSANNFKSFSLANSRTHMNSKQLKQDQSQIIIEQLKHSTNQIQQLKVQQHTQARKPLRYYPLTQQQQKSTAHQQPLSINKSIDRSFTGIKLGGSNKKKNSPQDLDSHQNKKSFKRKDSIETKRIELFSFTQSRINQPNKTN